jgi:tRNA pseudouridine38-40 synthase
MKIALGIEYSGERYCGWQKQSHSPSVQEPLEQALSSIANQPVSVFCAGRTDTGVHATGQVVHFEIINARPDTAWLRGANNKLPKDISIIWSKVVDQEFHARFSAITRSYRYIIQNSETPAAALANKVAWFRRKIDANLMQQGANYLLGTHDFSSFRASSCQANTATRTVESIRVTRHNQLIFLDICANAFLHHMVRNIVGCLLKIGDGSESPEYVKQILQYQDRTKAPDTARPDGLYLVGVGYQAQFAIPQPMNTPLGHSINN